jgi:AraC-like DNA-binding protein
MFIRPVSVTGSARAMDLLSDLLHEAGLRRRLLDLRRLGPATALQFPCEKSIGLHVVTHGRLWLHAPSLGAPLSLDTGDIAVMARGCVHVLSTMPSLDGAEVTPAVASPSQAGAAGDAAPAASGSDAPSVVISGAYQLWNTPLHPFFGEIPEWFVMRADEIPKLGPLALAVGLLDGEVNDPELGAETVVHGLLDVIFTHLLRAIVKRRADGGAGWSHAVRDPQVRQAIAEMHRDCARVWSLESLAAIVGVSRTGLAERFREAMGDTPMSYLRTVRMQRAIRLLSESTLNLEQVAQEVGYQDAFSFSKVFKREVGVSPRDFRRQDEQDKQLAWRFKAG